MAFTRLGGLAELTAPHAPHIAAGGSARIYEFPPPSEREGRTVHARRSPRRSSTASRSRWQPVSFAAIRWAWTTPARGVQQHVLLALANYHNRDTGHCDPSNAEIAEATGLGATTVRRAIRALEDAGLLIVKDTTGGRQQRARYVFPTDEVKTDTRPERPSKRGTKTRPERSSIAGDTQPERPSNDPDTRPERRENSAGAADVVLRTRTGKREPGTTGAAAAAPDTEDGLFGEPDRAATATTVNAGHAVAAWKDSYAGTHRGKPTSRATAQVGRECRQLLEAGNAGDIVIAAARQAGARGFATVEREFHALTQLAPGRYLAVPPQQQVGTGTERAQAFLNLKQRNSA